MPINITFNAPDFRGVVAAKKLKEAEDRALEAHRKTYLKHHFRKSAVQRYPSEFAAHKSSLKQRNDSRDEAQRAFAALSPQEQARRKAEISRTRSRILTERAVADKSSLRPLRGHRELPLVYTGRLRNVVLNGRIEFKGTAANRRMVFPGAPVYTFVTAKIQGQRFDKVKAIQAVRGDEVTAFARVVDAEVQKYLNDNRPRKY